jgi:replicative DNA helicase
MKPIRNTRDFQNSVLGALLVKPSLFIEVSNILHPRMFDDDLQLIASKIWEIKDKGQSFTISIIIDETNDREKVTELTQYARDGYKFMADYGDRIAKGWLTNEYFRISEEAQAKLINGEDYFKVMAEVEAERDLVEGMIYKEETLFDAVKAANQMVEDMLSPGLSGIDTGFTDLNGWTGGFRPGKLVIVAARPGVGKTTIALQYLTAACKAGKRCAFFSFEMSQQELLFELALQQTGLKKVDFIKRQVTDMDKEEIFEAHANIYEWPLYLIDFSKCAPVVQQVIDKARRLKEAEGLDAIFIDYMQLLTSYGSYQSRAYELGAASTLLKLLSQELQLPVIVLAQINRSSDNNPGKRPQISNIKDSGQLEQDADLIEILHRPEKYGIEEDAQGQSLKGILESIIAKNRFLGSIGEGLLFRQWKEGKYHMVKQNAFGEIERLDDKIEEPVYDPVINGQTVNDIDEIPF